MPTEIRIHGLDSRSLDSFLEFVPLGPNDYRREPEPAAGRKHAIPFEMIVLILSVSVPTVLSALAAWLAHNGSEVDLEVSVGKSKHVKWKIRPGRRKLEAIQAELEDAVKKVQGAETEKPARLLSPGKKIQPAKKALKPASAKKSTRVRAPAKSERKRRT